MIFTPLMWRYILRRDINEPTSDHRETALTFTKFMTSVAARTGEMLNYANDSDEVE